MTFSSAVSLVDQPHDLVDVHAAGGGVAAGNAQLAPHLLRIQRHRIEGGRVLEHRRHEVAAGTFSAIARTMSNIAADAVKEA
jgi:hypothetical protein